ncbi:MAG: glutamine synthetase type III [Chlorobi bacterium]|nr:MAG: glutamine synthetase type III [Bacteroidota bacterium]MBE2265605.1 glutamine synthetase III [Flavobacteriales bacterium]MBL1161696.1 glutamine synthetase type III [Chlorobiota bacterium]MBW7853943.1 glutamine synthetase III [Candidatus Kapabacteria bacterium]MCC6331820.1 glutamine synthetase III [Ignavibacteria bacterium]
MHTNATDVPRSAKLVSDTLTEAFADDVLTADQLRQRLSRSVWESISNTIDKATVIDSAIADTVALAMKTWAIEKGATHYSHWFQPLTGLTAEKHESFVVPTSNGSAISQFSGKELIQGEPDASSFPSGGLRATFEARGYTAWDPTSPAFIVRHDNGATLYIPTAFASWTGEALDHKIPLLRSTNALNHAVLKALKLFGDSSVENVTSAVGAEQEYFLVDAEYAKRRPDLALTGRTLFGARPPRGQELSDHYFGSIPNRVLSYMTDVEQQLFALGVPVRTRHNEVAPGQYEFAPLYEGANIAADHQQLVMKVLRNTARKHGFVCLLHEKPFSGINGSGKHVNWSIITNTGVNLLEPGDTPFENMMFLFFCTAIIRAVNLHSDLLRISVATASNDLRMGAHEAPPTIMSIYLGAELTDVFERIESGKAGSKRARGLLGLGSPVLPPIPLHSGDRNRTSPFAFTGNKFEFRAVGSSQTISFPVTVLNSIVAESVIYQSAQIEALLASGEQFENALRTVISSTYSEHKRILFDGDGYNPQWITTAAERGLPVYASCVDAYEQLTSQKNIQLFEQLQVFNARELEARQEVLYDQYFKTINIEAETTEWIARTMIVPAVFDFIARTQLVQTHSTFAQETHHKLVEAIDKFGSALGELHRQNVELGGSDVRSKCTHMVQNVLPAMKAVRHVADKLERICDSAVWPMPGYREMWLVR